MKTIDINNSENTNATLIYAAQKNIDIVTVPGRVGAYNPLGIHIDLDRIFAKGVMLRMFYGITDGMERNSVKELVQSKADPRIDLKIFNESEVLGKYANFALIDNQVLIRYIEVEKTPEEIAELIRLSQANTEKTADSADPKAEFSAEQWERGVIAAPKSGIEIYKDEPEVAKHIRLIADYLEKRGS